MKHNPINKLMRDDTARYMRECRNAIRRNNDNNLDYQPDKVSETPSWAILAFSILVVITIIFVMVGCAHAYTVDQYANAIYKAEGGAKTAHPYGIMGKWSKSPRIICINTVRHQFRLWKRAGQQGDFTAFLGAKYCPIGINDVGTNKYWVKNVNYWLKRG